MFLPFLSKPHLKCAFRSLKWGFLTLKWNLVLDFHILKLNFLLDFHDFRDYNFRLTEINLKKAEKLAEIIAELVRKLYGKFYLRIRKYDTVFHFKVRKPHFKQRKALFKRLLIHWSTSKMEKEGLKVATKDMARSSDKKISFCTI